MTETGMSRAGMIQDGRPESMAEGMYGGMYKGMYRGMDMAAEEAGEAEGLGADDDEILESLEILESPEVPDSLEAYDAKLNEAYAAPDPGSEAVPPKKTRRGRKPGTGRRLGRPGKPEQKQEVAEAAGEQDMPGQDMPGQAADLKTPGRKTRNFMVAACGTPMTPEAERQMVQKSAKDYEESLEKKTHPMLRFLKPGTDMHKISLAEAQQMMRDRLGLPDNGVVYRRQAPITYFCSDNGVPCYRDPQIQQEIPREKQQDDQLYQDARAGQAAQAYLGAEPRTEGVVSEDEKTPQKCGTGPVAGGSRGLKDDAVLKTAEAGEEGDDSKEPRRQQEADAVQNTVQDAEACHGPESAPGPHSGEGRNKQTKAGRLFVLIILTVLAGLAVWFSWTGAYGEGGGVPGLAAPAPDMGGTAGNADLGRPQAQNPESGRISEKVPEGFSEGVSGRTSGAQGMAEDSGSLPDADGPGSMDVVGMADMKAQQERLSEEDVLSYLASREASRKASGKARQEEKAACRDDTLPAPLKATQMHDSENDSEDAGSTDPVPSQAHVPQGSGTAARDGTRLEARLSAFEESLRKTEAGLLVLQQMLRDSMQQKPVQQKPAKDSPAAGTAVKEEVKEQAGRQASDAMHQQEWQKMQERNNDGRNDKKADKKNASGKSSSVKDKSRKDSPEKARKKDAVSSSENPALSGWRIQGLSESRAILQDARGRLWNMGAGEQTGSFMVHRVDAANGLVYTSRGILSLKAGK